MCQGLGPKQHDEISEIDLKETLRLGSGATAAPVSFCIAVYAGWFNITLAASMIYQSSCTDSSVAKGRLSDAGAPRFESIYIYIYICFSCVYIYTY